MKLNGIIFDFDGTLADTLPLCINSFKLAFEEVTGTTITIPEITKHFGLTEEGISKRMLDDKWELGFKSYIKYYQRDHHLYPGLFNGMPEILDYLRANNIKIALVTGKGKRSADITLNHYGITNYFEFVETGSTEASIKTKSIKKILEQWKIDPKTVAYVGDTETDIIEARDAGVQQISVSWASTSNHDLLAKHNPSLLFSKIEDFSNWIMTLNKA